MPFYSVYSYQMSLNTKGNIGGAGMAMAVHNIDKQNVPARAHAGNGYGALA